MDHTKSQERAFCEYVRQLPANLTKFTCFDLENYSTSSKSFTCSLLYSYWRKPPKKGRSSVLSVDINMSYCKRCWRFTVIICCVAVYFSIIKNYREKLFPTLFWARREAVWGPEVLMNYIQWRTPPQCRNISIPCTISVRFVFRSISVTFPESALCQRNGDCGKVCVMIRGFL